MFNLISKLNSMDTVNATICENIQNVASAYGVTDKDLAENVNNVLASLIKALKSKTRLKTKNPESIAAFLAGVDDISRDLSEPNVSQRDHAVDLLAKIISDPHGEISYATAPIMQIGTTSERLNRYKEIVNSYAQNPDNGSLLASVTDLNTRICRALQQFMGQKETTFDPTIYAAQPGEM